LRDRADALDELFAHRDGFFVVVAARRVPQARDQPRGDEERRAVKGKRGRGRRDRNHERAERGTDGVRNLLDGGHHRVGRGEIVLVDDRGDHREGRRVVAGREHRYAEGEADHQRGRSVGGRHRRHDRQDERLAEIDADHPPAPIESVGERAADRAERDERDLLGDNRSGNPPDRMGGFEDEHDQRDVVEPVAGLRHGQRAEETSKVLVAERAAPNARLCVSTHRRPATSSRSG
jgi:hypothetical protein